MIDWWALFVNSLWILGLAVILSAFSYADWQAHRRGGSLRQVLARPGFGVSFSMGAVLFCLGLLLSGRSALERVAWAVLAVLSAAQAWQSWRALPSGRAQRDHLREEA